MTQRVIEIPEDIREDIIEIFNAKVWSKERISDFTTEQMFQIQKKISNLSIRIESLMMQYSEKTIDSIDYQKNKIFYTDGSDMDIPEKCKSKIVELSRDIAILRESAGLISIGAQEIEYRSKKSMEMINDAIKAAIPQTQDGNWAIDLNSMKVIETKKEDVEKILNEGNKGVMRDECEGCN